MPHLTEYVLETALGQVARWRAQGLEVPVAVNVSPRDVHSPGFAGAVAARLARHGVPAGALQLEITEHVLLEDPQRAADTLAGLTGHGVKMSLDDFGTGYSSLVHLRRLPVSELKIDRSFVARLAVDTEDAEIVRCTVDLALPRAPRRRRGRGGRRDLGAPARPGLRRCPGLAGRRRDAAARDDGLAPRPRRARLAAAREDAPCRPVRPLLRPPVEPPRHLGGGQTVSRASRRDP